MKPIFHIFSILTLFACNHTDNSKTNGRDATHCVSTTLIILGTVQDGGSPHIACKKNNFLFEATPDLPRQMKKLQQYSPFSSKETPDAIFLTHAHIGHYAGLMYLGREAMNADKVPVYAMPRMQSFLKTNGPWSQLVSLNNISLQSLAQVEYLGLTSNIKITYILVPHRDEYSETVGYIILGPKKKALFIPDIDKWEKWNTDIIEEIASVDYAFIDGTFYDGAEINNRDISEIPHPFIIESMKKFKNLTAAEKHKIYFIHFNHTNPALNPESEQSKTILKNGFHIARMNMVFTL